MFGNAADEDPRSPEGVQSARSAGRQLPGVLGLWARGAPGGGARSVTLHSPVSASCSTHKSQLFIVVSWPAGRSISSPNTCNRSPVGIRLARPLTKCYSACSARLITSSGVSLSVALR
jgi:hypothetical protein